MSEPLILVRWAKHVGPEARDWARSQRGMKRVESPEWDKVGIELYELPPGLAKKSVEWLVAKGWCEAEVDGDAEAIPLDPSIGQAMSYTDLLAGSTWYQQRMGIPSVWTASTGNGIKVGVADSGANHEHEWLKESIVASKNFVANETTVNDNEGHGTACAGIVKAIARDCSLVVARVMSQNVCKWSAWGPGVIWLADQGCTVVSSSIGGQTDSFSITSATAYAAGKGCKVVCAAGNAGTQTNSYPAASTNAVAVSATDEADNKAGFSQWGAFIDITAPGVNLVTSHGGGYASFSGTSGSTPIIAGCVALIAAKLKSSGEIAWQKLVSTCRDLGNALYFGAGIPDLLKALDIVPTTPPDAPAPTDKPAAPSNLRASDLTSTSYRINWDQTPYAYNINRWEIFGGDNRADTVEARYGRQSWTCHWWTYGNGPRKKWFRVRAIGNDGKVSDLSPYLDESLPAGTTPPPPPPPEVPNLSTSTLSALVVIENDIPSYTRAIDRVELKNQLNRLAAML